MFSLFVSLFARLAFLQVVETSTFATAANKNQTRVIREDAPRGRILDRDGVVLAGNRDVDVIAVERSAIKDDPTLLPRIAAFLGISESDVRAKASDPRRSQFRPAIVADHLDKPTIIAFREHQSEFVGAQVATVQERSYPLGDLGAHVIGYIGEANERELALRKSQGYKAGDPIGKYGVEASFEDELRGKPGQESVEVDAKGRVVRVLERKAPLPGRDVRLTLSAKVQRVAQSALLEGLEVARSQKDLSEGAGPNAKLAAPAGSVVALDPRDGGVLAMASYPTFDPGRFSSGITSTEYAELTDPARGLPLNNRALQGQYAPGSTFKLFTALAALRANAIDTGTPFVDTGVFTLGDRKYRNAQGKVYGTIAMARAITVSSDVYFYQLGNQLWNSRKKTGDAIQDVAREFGLGSRLGIELGSEASGRIPDPASRKKQHSDNPKAFPEGDWYAGDNVNLAIGQGDTLTTPMQLASAYAAFGANGKLYRPHVLFESLNHDGTTARKASPEVVRVIALDARARAALEEGLRGVVTNPAGTAYTAFANFNDAAFPVAGKTGTAQVTGKQDSALFVAYGPSVNPTVSVSVVLEQAGFGGAAAAPVARRVFEAVANLPITPMRLGSGED